MEGLGGRKGGCGVGANSRMCGVQGGGRCWNVWRVWVSEGGWGRGAGFAAQSQGGGGGMLHCGGEGGRPGSPRFDDEQAFYTAVPVLFDVAAQHSTAQRGTAVLLLECRLYVVWRSLFAKKPGRPMRRISCIAWWALLLAP